MSALSKSAALRDLRADWRRWSRAERIAAALLMTALSALLPLAASLAAS